MWKIGQNTTENTGGWVYRTETTTHKAIWCDLRNLKLDRNDYDMNKLKEKTRHNELYKLIYTVLTLYLLLVKLITSKYKFSIQFNSNLAWKYFIP